MQTSLSRSAAAQRSIRGAASSHASPDAWSTIAKIAQRPSAALQPSVASVAHSVSGTLTVIVPSCRRRARLRTCGVGASSAAPRVRRRTRLRDVQIPRWRRRAVIFLWPSPTNGDSAISRRIARKRSSSGIAPTGPGRRRTMQASGSEVLRRRRARTPPTWTPPRPGRPGPTAAPAVLRRSAPRPARAPIHLLVERPQDVELHRQLTHLALRLHQAAVLLGPRPQLQALPPGGQELLTPPADPARGLAGLPREGVQALSAQQPQDHLLLAARAPAHLPAALRATVRRTGARLLAAVHPGPHDSRHHRPPRV